MNGSIRKRPDGKLFYDVRVEVPGTRKKTRRRISLETRDIKLARIKAAQIDGQLGITPVFDRMRLDDFVPYYVQWAQSRREAESITNYRSILKRLQDDMPNIVYMDEISRVTAENFVQQLSRSKVRNKGKDTEQLMSGRGVNYYLRALRGIFNYAVDWQMIPDNPFNKIERLKESAIRPRVFKRSELKLFFNTLRKKYPEYFDVFVCYLFTGLRRNEALSLTQDDIMFDSNSILVHGKGDKYRAVPMMPIVKEILANRAHMHRPFPWSKSNITHIFIKVCAAAGIKGVKLHDLRKTFSTMMSDFGVSGFFIQQWLGHEDGKVTLTHYIGFNDELTTKKMSEFEKALISDDVIEQMGISSEDRAQNRAQPTASDRLTQFHEESETSKLD